MSNGRSARKAHEGRPEGTTPSGFSLTRHARERAMSRGFDPEDFDFILEHGEFLRDRLDRSVYVLPESPFAILSRDSRFSRLMGIAVVLAPDGGTIVTAYERDPRFRHCWGDR